MSAASSATKRKRSSAKKPKDDNAPKRPLSGYFSWLQPEREAFKLANPDIKGPAVVKALGEKWAKMTDEEKQPWNDSAKAAKEEYDRQMEIYRQTDDFAAHQDALKAHKAQARTRSGSTPKPKDASAPKRPMSAYFIWLNENRASIKAANPGLPPPKIVKLGGEKWAAMTKEEKQPFDDKAAEAKKAYEAALATYRQSQAYADHQAALEEWRRSKSASKGREGSAKKRKLDPNAKKAPSAFDIFANERRPAVMAGDTSLSFTAANIKLRDVWREMAKEDKAGYVASSKKLKSDLQAATA